MRRRRGRDRRLFFSFFPFCAEQRFFPCCCYTDGDDVGGQDVDGQDVDGGDEYKAREPAVAIVSGGGRADAKGKEGKRRFDRFKFSSFLLFPVHRASIAGYEGARSNVQCFRAVQETHPDGHQTPARLPKLHVTSLGPGPIRYISRSSTGENGAEQRPKTDISSSITDRHPPRSQIPKAHAPRAQRMSLHFPYKSHGPRRNAASRVEAESISPPHAASASANDPGGEKPKT